MAVSIHDKKNHEKEARLNEYRLALGKTIHEFCAEVGITPGEYCALNNGTKAPVYLLGEKAGSLRPDAEAIIRYLEVEPYDLFPRYFCQIGEDKDVLPSQLSLLTRRESCEDYEFREIVEKCIEGLNNKEMHVFNERIIQGRTLGDIAQIFHTTIERVRQIEARALRKIKETLYSLNIKPKGGSYIWLEYNEENKAAKRQGIKEPKRQGETR